MSTAYIAVALVTAAANFAAAAADFVRPRWLMDNMNAAGLPRSWVFPLGALKAAGALGLLVGFAVPPIGIAAAAGLFLYFVGAIIALVRARCYAQLPYPAPYLLLAAATLALQLSGSS